MGKKLVIGHSGAGKSWFLIGEAWADAVSGKRVLHVRRDSGDVLNADFEENLVTIVGESLDESTLVEKIKFLTVSEDFTEKDLETIQLAFKSHKADVVFLDAIEGLLTLELFEGAEKVVHTSQRYPKSDVGVDLTEFDIVELGSPVRPLGIDVTKLNVVSIDVHRS